MRSQPISEYIWFGLFWRYLQDAGVGSPVHGDSFVLSNIARVLTGLETLGLSVTLRAADELVELRDQLQATPAGATLTAAQASHLQKLMLDLQRTLSAEAHGHVAYIVTDKRLDIRKLLNGPQALFAPDVFQKLPAVAKYDFVEAAFCIAFERPTAAAFHLLRGTEDVLRTYYCTLVRRNRVDPLLWGPMVQAIRNRRNPPPVALLNNLDNMRHSFRNPTQHPEKIYDIHEVQDLFGLCIDVVNRMVRNPVWLHGA